MVEFGTKTHPYKNIGFVFVELLNYHSHSDRNISVYVMENTQNYMHLFRNYIVNTTYVEILPYSNNDTAIPSKPTIIAMDEASLTDTKGTSLNILQNYDLRVAEAITENPDISESEKNNMQFEVFVMMIMRSNFYMDNFDVTSEYGSLNENKVFLYPVYLQSKLFKLTNSHFRMGGVCLNAVDPLNMHLENIDIDYNRNLGGFHVAVD